MTILSINGYSFKISGRYSSRVVQIGWQFHVFISLRRKSPSVRIQSKVDFQNFRRRFLNILIWDSYCVVVHCIVVFTFHCVFLFLLRSWIAFHIATRLVGHFMFRYIYIYIYIYILYAIEWLVLVSCSTYLSYPVG